MGLKKNWHDRAAIDSTDYITHLIRNQVRSHVTVYQFGKAMVIWLVLCYWTMAIVDWTNFFCWHKAGLYSFMAVASVVARIRCLTILGWETARDTNFWKIFQHPYDGLFQPDELQWHCWFFLSLPCVAEQVSVLWSSWIDVWYSCRYISDHMCRKLSILTWISQRQALCPWGSCIPICLMWTSSWVWLLWTYVLMTYMGDETNIWSPDHLWRVGTRILVYAQQLLEFLIYHWDSGSCEWTSPDSRFLS